MTRYALALLTVFIITAAAADEPVRFKQETFAISFLSDPPADARMDTRYAELAAAHFTVTLGGFHAVTVPTAKRQLKYSHRHGMGAILTCPNTPAAELPTGLGCWGYGVADEPSAADFPRLRREVDAIRAAHPGKLALINLLPDYASAAQLGVDDYEEYVRRFVREVDVDVLCMDHYPALRPDADGREGYCDNLAVMRAVALDANIPHWNFFNAMPWGPHDDPTEAHLRWQVYTSLAYGSKGVLYFSYWPLDPNFAPHGAAIMTQDGRPTRHYAEATRLNAALKQLGPTLMQLTSTGVYRVRQDDAPTEVLRGSPLRDISSGEFLIGGFRHADGRRAVLINNYRFAYTAWPTVTFDAPPDDIVEVCPRTGQEVPLRDDSPAMPGVQLSLDAAGGRLFLLPAD